MSNLLLLASLVLAPLASAEDGNPTVAPAEGERGKVQVWKSAGGIDFEYYVPPSYDPERGANLTVVLHGNGLDHRWTFWNHPAGEFRPDDIIVSPDGTSPLNGVNEFLGGSDDVERFHALLQELEGHWKVNQTFLYGHSQGSFFVFFYAGEHPEDVDGVCGHASGAWMGTKTSKAGQRQAIGILHGTDDHVPYGQGVGARTMYEDAKYPLVHLRTLFDWPHRPHWMQAESVLSWCEGMTSTDPDRVERCLEELAEEDRPMGVDWGALYAVAERLGALDGATQKQKNLGKRLADAVDDLATRHLAEITKSAGKGKLSDLRAGAWSGHLTRLVEDFRGVPAFEAFRKKNKKVFAVLEEDVVSSLSAWWRKQESDENDAFALGLDVLEHGFTNYQCVEIAGKLEAMAGRAKEIGLSKKDLERFESVLATWREGRRDGFKEFEALNAKAKL